MSNDLNFSSPLTVTNNLEFSSGDGALGGQFNSIQFNGGLFNQFTVDGFQTPVFIKAISYEGSSLESFVLGTAPLITNYSGEELNLDFITFKLLAFNDIPTGEQAKLSTIFISKLLEPIGYSGEYGVFNSLYTPPRAEFSIDGSADEYAQINLSSTYNLPIVIASGELSSSSLTPVDYGSYILSEGPAAYWRFNETTGLQAADSTGNNSAATISGATLGNTSPVASKSSFYFDGTDTVAGNPTGILSANLTQELWVKPDADATIALYTATSSGTQAALSQRYALWPLYGGTGSGGGLSVGSNGIQIVAHGSSYMPVLFSYQHPISTTEYTHILVSWNDRTPTLYVNGVAVGTGYQARAPFNSQGLPSSGQYGYYKGFMQDVAIYTSALTAEQAREHYLAGIGLHYIPRFEPLLAFSDQRLEAVLTLDLEPLGNILNYTGEYTQVFLENNVRFSIDGSSGEHAFINHDHFTIVPNSTFTHFHGAASHSETSSCITLNSLTSSTNDAGINAYFSLPFQLVNDRDITFRFKRTKSVTWYDDDFTDASLWFCLFPNWSPASITFTATSWGYDRPNYYAHIGALIVYMRHSANGAISVNWINASGTLVSNSLTVNSNWTTNELNGTDECSIVIKGSSSNTIIKVYGLNDTLRQSGTFSNMANPFANGRSETIDTFLIHYHNYTGSQFEKLCDMSFGTQEGIILVPFINIGIIQAYSSEVLEFNLRTSSIFSCFNYTGELNELVLSIYPSFNLGSIVNPTGETTSLVLLTSSIIEAIAPAGEINNTILTVYPSAGLGINKGYSGEELLSVLTAYSIFRDVDARDGQNVSTSLSVFPSALLEPVGLTGENNLLSLSTSPALSIAFTFISDEYANLSLASEYRLSAQASSAENAFASLTVFYPSVFTPNFYSGQSTNASLRTADVLTVSGTTGEYTSLSLKIFEASFLYLPSFTGETALAEIKLGITFPNIGYTGENVLFDIDYIVNPGMPISSYTGEEGIFSLVTKDALSLYAVAGEKASLYLGLSEQFLFKSLEGQYVAVDLALNLFDQLPANAYSGQTTAAELSTRFTFKGLGYSGERILFDLYQNLPAPILPNFLSGENVLLTFQTSTNIPIGRFYSGGYGIISSLAEEPNIRCYTDQTLNDFSLSTSYIFKLTGSSGERLTIGFTIGPSEPIGEFKFYEGTVNYNGLDVIYHADLYVTFRTSIYTQCDIGSATYFDLATDACCGYRPKSNNLILNMSRKDHLPESVSFGDRVIFSFNLSCAPRFKCEMPTGSLFELIDNLDFIEVDFYDGTNFGIQSYEADLTHRLCKGYFIPSGNWVVVEMNDILLETCYSDRMYGGEFVSCFLSAEPCFYPTNYFGEGLWVNLTTDPPWLLIFYSGENMLVNLSLSQAMPMFGRYGEVLSVSFYEPPFLIYTGETADFDFVTEYKIRFKEEGCFDNEFVYQNDDGDSIEEMFNPVPVEGEPFTHSILAECF